MYNKFSRIVCGILSVVMCIFSTVHVTNISAEVVEEIPEYEDAITVNALSVALKRSDGSFAEINEWTEVKNGDKLSLDFEWTANTEAQSPLTFVYDLSDALKNISLDNIKITTADATYRVENQKLYIDIEKGKSGRLGSCRLEGTVDLSNAAVDERGVTTLTFIDKTVSAYAPSKVTGVLVEKSAVECAVENDNYYQYFTVKVTNKSSEKTVTGATLIDTFASTENMFSGTTLEDYKVSSSNGTVLNNHGNVTAGTSITLPEITANDYVTVSYKVKVDKEAALNQKSGENIATVSYDKDGTAATAEGRAKANPDVPVVTKTGAADEKYENVTYTITVDPGTLVADSTSFVVVDAPDGISADEIAGAINEKIEDENNKASSADGVVTIPVGALTLSDGVYTLTYTVALPDSFKNQIVNKNVKNNLSVTFDSKYEYTANSDIYIPANGTAIASKSYTNVNYETGVIDWEVKLFIPNDDSETNKLSSYTYSDWLNGDVSGALGEKGKSYFNDGGATDSAEKAAAVISNVKINGKAVDDTVATYDIWTTNSTNISNLQFTEDFLDTYAGQTVTLTYSSTMDTSVDGYEKLVYTNSSQVSFAYEDGTSQYLQAHAYVSPNFYTNKKAIHASTTENNAVKWSVVLKSHSYNFTSGEKITVTDTLPAGYRIISDKYGIAAEGWEPEAWNTDYKDLVSYVDSVDSTTDVQTVTFTITVNDTLKALIDRTGSNNYLAVVFEAAMTDDYYEEFNMKNSTGEAVDITNNATVTVGGTDYDVSCTSQVTPAVPDGILSKTSVSSKVTDGNGNETGTFESTYTIVVNESAEKLLGEGSSELVLTDTLGTWLELDESSISVTPEIAASDISYDKSSRTITFKLEDAKTYTITYDVTGDCAKFKTLESDETGISKNDAEAMFSNTVTLKGQDISGISVSEMLDSTTYETDATYKYDVLLSGEKMWSKETDTAVIPKKVTINLKETMTSTTGEVTVNSESRTIDVSEADGKWTYKIENLVSKDENGNRYTYEIVEVNVGGDTIENSGFTVTYADASSTETDDGEEIVINFTNDFTAIDKEIGALKVAKDWDHGSNANTPNEVTVTLYEVNDGTETKVGDSKTITGESTVTFENLPLYNYSRDANDKLVRTLRQYKVVETAVSGYKTTYSVDGTFTLTDVVAAGTVVKADNAKKVTITNTYEAPAAQQEYGSIKVTKNWVDTANTENIPHPAITVVLSSDDGEDDRTETINSSDATVTFADLPVYKTDSDGKVTDEKITYTVTENAVEGYTVTYSGNENIQLENNVTDNVTVTNTFNYTIEKGSISVSKVWQDASGNVDDIISDSVIVTLYADGTQVGDAATVTSTTPASFTDLPLYKYTRKADGSIEKTLINYTVSETTVTGYTATYTVDNAEMGNGFNLTADKTKSVTVTNKKDAADQKYGSVKVTKNWVDENNTTNIAKPASITVVLSSDDGAGNRTGTINSSDATVTFEKLPVYKTENNIVTENKVTYTLTEISVDGYSTTYKVDVGDEKSSCDSITLTPDTETDVTVTNTFNYTIEKGSVSVSKVWQDENGSSMAAPVDISVTLSDSVDGNSDQMLVITKGSSSVTFDNLPIYESYARDTNGNIIGVNPITYYISETAVTGYETTYSVDPTTGLRLDSSATGTVTITNKKIPQSVGKITVTKKWVDTANTENIPHPAITVILKADGQAVDTKTISADSTTAAFENLPVYKTDANGNVTTTKIQYSVEEQSAVGYSTVAYSPTGSFALTENGESKVEITNTFDYTIEKGSISVSKVWQDENGTAIASQGDVTVTLYADGIKVGNAATVTSTTPASFTDLPLYKYTREADGSIAKTAISYTVSETAVTGYTATYTVDSAEMGNGFNLTADKTKSVTVTNKKDAADQKYGSVKVTKVWSDNNDKMSLRPDEITVKLLADGAETGKTATLTASTLTAEFTNLPVYKTDGNIVTDTKIKYSVEEQQVDGYTASYSVKEIELTDGAQSAVTVTNTFTFTEELGSIKVTKKWLDSNGDPLAINDKITVVIKADGTEAASDTITGSGSNTFENLPVYKYTRGTDGSITKTPITYTVTETGAVSGYKVSYTLDGSQLTGGFNLTDGGTRDVVIENKQIAIETPSVSESSTSKSTSASSSASETSGGSGGGDDSGDSGDSTETTPTKTSTETAAPTVTVTAAPTGTTKDEATTTSTVSESETTTTTTTVSSASGSGTTSTTTVSSEGSSGTKPSYTSPSYIQTTTTVKNTTTTKAADTEEDDETTTTSADEKPDETTVVDEDTDTTKPADSEDYEEDDSDEIPESDAEEDEMNDEDGSVDDYIGEDTDFETDIEENPHTSITINFGYVLAFAFGTYAFFPRKKKQK